MVEGSQRFESASFKDKATSSSPEKLPGIDIKALYAKPEKFSAAAETNGGIYGAGVIAGLEREGVLLKRTVLNNSISGIRSAIADEWSHKTELAGKAVSGLAMGSVMRLLLPKEGVAKAVAATAMVGYFVVDAARPLVKGASEAWSARNDHELNNASGELAKNLSKFAIDSGIGMATGVLGARGTGALLESKSAFISRLPGASGLRKFDAWKEEQLTSTQKPIGRFLQNRADNVDNFFDRVQDHWNPFRPSPRPTVELPSELKIQRLAEVADKIFDHNSARHSDIQGSEEIAPTFKFHHVYNDAPEGMDHSDYLDSLIAKGNANGLAEGTLKANIHQEVSSVPVPELPIDAGPAVPDSIPGVEAASLLSKQSEVIASNNALRTASISEPKLDLDPAVISKVAAVARVSQALWTPERVSFADYRDAIQGPAIGVTDPLRMGSMLRPEYDFSSKQIVELASQIDSAAAEKKAGMLLMLHTRAALQVLARRPDTIDYNNFNDELHGYFLEGLRRAGVSESIMSGKVPALTAVTDDKGSGYFVVPGMDGILERPLLVVPRSMSGMRSTMSGVLRHEETGHVEAEPQMAKFPENLRDDLIGEAVDNAMKAKPLDPPKKTADEPNVVKQIQKSLLRLFEDDSHESKAAGIDSLNVTPRNIAASSVEAAMADKKIANVKIKLGDETVTKSEFFKRLLYAEAGENTADFMGTATGGFDTPLTLGVLLQSIRKGGFLETRNIYGKQFEHGIEPHGIDRWRIKFCAEAMRQISPEDPVVAEYADALDLYAQKASRPGESNYIFASVDNAGETISIPMQEWDAVIPHIIKAQLDTPLDALKTEKFVQAQLKDPSLEPGDGDLKTLRDIIWGHSEMVRNIDALANRMVDAVQNGQSALPGAFDNKEFTIGQVFSAGLIAWLRATRRGEDPTSALEKIDVISEQLRATYRSVNPHLTVLTPRVSTVMKVDTMRGLSVAARQAVSSLAGQNRNLRKWTEGNANWLAGTSGVNLTGDLMDVDKKQKELFGN